LRRLKADGATIATLESALAREGVDDIFNPRSPGDRTRFAIGIEAFERFYNFEGLRRFSRSS